MTQSTDERKAVDIVLNNLNASLHNAGWVANSIMKVAQRDAQVHPDRDQDGDNNVKATEPDGGGTAAAG